MGIGFASSTPKHFLGNLIAGPASPRRALSAWSQRLGHDVSHFDDFRSRPYDPGSGRFLSQDSIGLASGDTNPYRFGFNSHPNATDPSGHVIRWCANPRVTQELAPGETRTPQENAAARQFFENHRDKARAWWEQRTGREWPKSSTHDHHPRELVNGGDPLLVEPGYGASTSEHSREVFKEQGRIGGIRSGEVRRK
ncbi:MAG: hypothetical protein K8T91_02180 [Planctomycetes bacterium]|nr:hypothetical protein [Planctomycetota bacterium]